MPRNKDIKKVLVIGSGPIIIGQAAEFDYAGTQACRSLKEEGLEVVLLNSNPATIMTDKDIADQVYIEPLTVSVLEKIIAKEKPDSVLPTLGGQAGLNLGMELSEKGILDKYGVKLIGTTAETIFKAEDRQAFKDTMEKIGEPCAASEVVHNVQDGIKFTNTIGYPVVLRPAYTLGGSGGGIAHDETELIEILTNGLRLSRVGEVLVERCIAGWKEIEYEVMRDANGNCITVCNMENIDPVGVHTGDSITVAPCFTLTDREYQKLRDIGIAIIRGVGVDTGAYQAVQCRLRRPRTFAGAMGLSGLYDMGRFLGSAEDDLVLRSSPLAALHKNGICDKNVLSKAEENSLLLCVGQGGYESDALADTQALADTLSEVGFPCHLEVWGGDVSHDWYWWGKEFGMFAERLFG